MKEMNKVDDRRPTEPAREQYSAATRGSPGLKLPQVSCAAPTVWLSVKLLRQWADHWHCHCIVAVFNVSPHSHTEPE
jgi:hypothetical protein